MKQFFFGFVSFVLILLFCFQNVNACSIISISPLRKEFGNAKTVFIGKIVKISDNYVPTDQEKSQFPHVWSDGYWRDKNIFSKVTMETNGKWKGRVSNKQEFIAVANNICGCPNDFRQLREGEEYLVFAVEKNFITVCDSHKTEFDSTKEKMKRLDSFWFRTWARIYPF